MEVVARSTHSLAHVPVSRIDSGDVNTSSSFVTSTLGDTPVNLALFVLMFSRVVSSFQARYTVHLTSPLLDVGHYEITARMQLVTLRRVKWSRSNEPVPHHPPTALIHF